MTGLLSFVGPIAMWALPLLPAEEIYNVFKTRKNPNTNAPFSNDYEKNLQEKVFTQMDDFLKTQNIRKDLKIIEMPNDGVCTTLGSNSFNNGGIIICCPGLERLDDQAFRWVFKHEISHLKSNDALLLAIAQTVVFIASVAFLHLGLGLQPFTTTFLTLAINIACTKIFRNYIENRADRFANHHATIDELKGGLRLLHALRTIDQGGFSFFHPSTDSRIKNVEKELVKRKATYVVEPEKITQLVKLIT